MTKNRQILFLAAFLAMLMMSATALANGVMAKDGMRGESVRRVQAMLLEQGYLKKESSVDGICGKETVAAIRHFQKDNKLKVDGICGELTYAELKKKSKLSFEDKDNKSDGNKKKGTVNEPHKGEVVYVEATGYSAYDPGNGSHTASGTLVRHGVIAVDPSFIPLGSRVFIPGYGEAVAEDIGWAIQGNRIDVAFDTHEEAIEFGRQELEIYILEYADGT